MKLKKRISIQELQELVSELEAKLLREEKRLREIKRSLRVVNRLRRGAQKRDNMYKKDSMNAYKSNRPNDLKYYKVQEGAMFKMGCDLYITTVRLKYSKKMQIDNIEILHKKIKELKEKISAKLPKTTSPIIAAENIKVSSRVADDKMNEQESSDNPTLNQGEKT